MELNKMLSQSVLLIIVLPGNQGLRQHPFSNEGINKLLIVGKCNIYAEDSLITSNIYRIKMILIPKNQNQSCVAFSPCLLSLRLSIFFSSKVIPRMIAEVVHLKIIVLWHLIHKYTCICIYGVYILYIHNYSAHTQQQNRPFLGSSRINIVIQYIQIRRSYKIQQ